MTYRRERTDHPTTPTTTTTTSPRQTPSRTKSEIRHEQYLDKLRVPTLDEIADIAQVQEEKERVVQEKYNSDQEKEKAAGAIQRTYRGHRARRQLNGFTLDPATRWIEAVNEARYRNLTTPRARKTIEKVETKDPGKPPQDSPRISSEARHNWQHVAKIAQHAHGSDFTSSTSDSDPDSDSSSSSNRNPLVQKASDARKALREKRKQSREWKGKAMDLPYFLEMVDLKHRYGSNLRAYHAEWKRSDTRENFFYWLDHGEGKEVELEMCSRERLEREQVRYLSREERMHYLVSVDSEGKLCWQKNGARIDTTAEWKDSIHGIVPNGEEAPKFREAELAALQQGKNVSGDGGNGSDSELEDEDDEDDEDEGEKRYPDPENMKKAKGPKKIVHVSPAVILNRLLRKTTKKNTWIFVADTSMNLYVGIKQSGSFQHSSFMRGSRISAAGLIKIKRGQLRSLSPLSGHYRPPASAFRHFIAHLRSLNVDMSHVSISKSYAVLVGLESYLAAKSRVKKAEEKLKGGVEMLVHPEQAKRRKEEEKDGSESAKLEMEYMRREKEERGLGRILRDVKRGVVERKVEEPGEDETSEKKTEPLEATRESNADVQSEENRSGAENLKATGQKRDVSGTHVEEDRVGVENMKISEQKEGAAGTNA